jgi:hypothetical protein
LTLSAGLEPVAWIEGIRIVRRAERGPAEASACAAGVL